MKKYIKGSILLLFCVSWSVFAMDTPDMIMDSDAEVDAATYKQLVNLELAKRRVLLGFFDESEHKDFDAIDSSVLSALYQEVGPILISTSILKHIIEIGKSDDRSTEDLKDAMVNATVYDSTKQNVLLSRVCFKPDQWIIKKVNDALSLMISRKQLKFFNVDWNKANEHIDADLISDVELKLGLRINHLWPIGIYDILQHEVKEKGAGCSADEIKFLFCKKQDYVSKNMVIPEWYIFMNGHGSFTRRVAGMPLDTFQSLLGLFSSYINTQMLFVKSCFAMGVNAKKIYEETPFGLTKQYPFPIIALGFNDIPTSARSAHTNPHYGRPAPKKPDTLSGTLPPNYVYSKEELEWMFYEEPEEMEEFVDWNRVLQLTRQLDIDFGQIAKILPAMESKNTPQIKLPSMEWFSVMDVDKKTVSIGSILAQIRSPQKPLDVATYFKKDPAVILLRTDDIPFELKLDRLSRLEHITSMVSSGPMVEKPDFVIHRIKKISFPINPVKKSVLEWLRLFELSGAVRGSKIFFVEEFEDKKNLVLFGLPTEPGMVILKAYFEDKDDNRFVTQFKWQMQSGDIVADKMIRGSEDEQDYLEKIKLATIGYPQAKAANAIKRVMPERIKKIQDVYSEQHIGPGPRGKRMYEELKK